MRTGLRVDRSLIGLRVGSGWRIERVIGCGGTATVFRGQKPDGQLAAIKLMHHQLASAWTKRFEREAKLLQSLSHPAIPRLFEFGRLRGVPFLVMELLTGRSLDVPFTAPRSSATLSQILEHAIQTLHALTVVHARGIVHRDLKPSNLFLTEQGVLKVLDFGAAVDLEAASTAPDSLTSGLLGTPAYMPPEQARGRWDMVDRRSDIWSLGAVLFTLLSGEHVHTAQTPNEQLSFAMTRSARSLAMVAPDLDASLVRAVDRALAYEREERFQSAEAFRQALLGSIEGERAPSHDILDITIRETGSAFSGPKNAGKPAPDSRLRWRKVALIGSTASCVLAAVFVRTQTPTLPSSSRAQELGPPASKTVMAAIESTAAATTSMVLQVPPVASVSVVGKTNSDRGRTNGRRSELHGAHPPTSSPSPASGGAEAAQPSQPLTASLVDSTQTALDVRLRTVGDEVKAAGSHAPLEPGTPAGSPLDIRR